MPLYEITLEQSYFGQQCINRFNYRCDSVPSGSSGAYLAVVAMGAIADDDTEPFAIDTILGQLQGIQVNTVTFVQMVAKNIYSNTDFYTYAFPVGTVGLNNTGEGLSPASAWGLTSNRTRADIRRAQKRFVGVGENYVGAGGNLTSGGQDVLEALGTLLGNPNTATIDAVSTVFNPVVLGRQKYMPEGSDKYAYRYYPTEVEQLEHVAPITEFNAKTTVRTQTSRQYGRGS